MGDFNLNLYNPFNLRNIRCFIDGMLSFNCFPVINIPTMINENNIRTKYSLIDHIWTNFKKGSNHVAGVIDYLISDHLPMFYVFSHSCSEVVKVVKFRSLSGVNIQRFISSIDNVDFTSVYSAENPNDAFKFFYDKFFHVFNSSFPIQKKKLNRKKSKEPWVTPLLKKCIKKKYFMYNLLRRGLILRRDFLKYKKLLLWVTKRIKQNYYNDEFTKIGGDTRKTWKSINSLLSRGKENIIKHIYNRNGGVLKGIDAANYFNNFFTNVATDLLQNVFVNNNFSFLNKINPILDSFYLCPTNEVEINDIMLKLPNKANSLYDIKPKILLQVKTVILPLLVYLFNYCIKWGTYPNILKLARIVPVFKDGSLFQVTNYRPISNLITFNKIFEILIYNRLNSFVLKNNILSNIQFGFRSRSNTNLAIFTLLKDFMKAFNRKSYTIALFIDLRKAFDLVDRNILLRKLYTYGIRGIAHDFIKSYLSNRTQYTTFDNFDSTCLETTHGVPQGSVLGPALFNLFINDICNIPDAEKVLFADDTVLYVSDDNLDVCVERINLIIKNLLIWLSENRLLANTNKTKLMLITPKFVDRMPVILFDGEVLEWVTHIKYLGMYLDRNLNFIRQTDEICGKLSRFQGVFYALAPLVPRSVLVKIYYSLVYPTLIQNIIIWGGLYEIHYNRVSVILNKILRIILNVKSNEHNIPLVSVNTMYKQLGFLKFKDIFRYFLLKFIHFISYDRFDIFIDNFAVFLPSNQYNIRNNRINLPLIRTNTEKHFTIYQACLLMREIPEDLIVPQSAGTLKKKFKQLCLSRY